MAPTLLLAFFVNLRGATRYPLVTLIVGRMLQAFADFALPMLKPLAIWRSSYLSPCPYPGGGACAEPGAVLGSRTAADIQES
jgi:hypothetical protein